VELKSGVDGLTDSSGLAFILKVFMDVQCAEQGRKAVKMHGG
jgi:hypothetical protein